MSQPKEYLTALNNRKYYLGFTAQEIDDLLKKLKVSRNKFNKAYGVNTISIIDGVNVYYPVDVERALAEILKYRAVKPLEWD